MIFCDQIMGLGFTEAFKAGISFGKDDMVIPDDNGTSSTRPATRSRSSSSSTWTA